MSAEVKMDKALFWRRTKQLYAEWKAARPWGGQTPVGAVMLLRGKRDDDVMYSRGASLQHWLFGYELYNTCVVFGEKEVVVAANANKVRILRQLGEADSDGDLRLELVEVAKGEYDSAAARLLKAVKDSKGGSACGFLKKENATGPLAEAVMGAVKPQAELVDVSAHVALLLHVKSSREVRNTRNAAEFATTVLRRYLLPEVETIIDQEAKVKHSKLADKCEAVFEKPQRVKSKLSADDLDLAYSPVVQSGGTYDLRPSAMSDDRVLAHTGVIMLSVGSRYREYCASLTRTYFVDPYGKQAAYYKVLEAAFAACRRALQPGRRLGTVYEAAVKAIKASAHPELVEHLRPNCGHGTGLEFRDGTLLINAKSRREIRAGMVFSLAVGFQNLPPGGDTSDGPAYAMMVADTALVVENDDDGAELLTRARREWDKVFYNIGDADESGSGSDEEMAAAEAAAAASEVGPTARRTRGLAARESTMEANLEKEKAAREKRRMLEQKKQEELRRRLESKGDASAPEEEAEEKAIEAYRTPLDFPSQARRPRIYVDQLNETVLMPINGRMVPFHISTIKNVTLTDNHPYKLIRFSFLTPDMPFSQKKKLPAGAEEDRVFVQEVTYRSKSRNFEQVHFDVNQLRKQAATLRREREEKVTLVEQPSLKLCARGTRIPRLNDVSVLPAVARGKVTGVVEAHINGLRFTSRKHGVKLDVVYQNIKHAFFQVARKDTMSVVLHFQLRNDIMVNKKKTSFVQFYFDVVEASQDLDSRVRHGDEDGLVEEQEERRLRSSWNKRFKDFAKEVEDMSARHNPEKYHVEFDSPYTELKFEGVVNKEVTKLLPTVHCLVSLDDSPPACVTLDDVELVSFERVQFQLRNFDLVFVFKDFTRTPLTVTAIPSKYLDTIKDWLDSINILHYESRINMVWKKILETIREDPKEFYENGGWSFLGPETGSDNEEDESEGESEFEPDADESFEESSEEYESSDEDSYSSEEDESELEESGDDWDELERQAERDDRQKRAREAEREDHRPSKRRR